MALPMSCNWSIMSGSVSYCFYQIFLSVFASTTSSNHSGTVLISTSLRTPLNIKETHVSRDLKAVFNKLNYSSHW